MVGSRRMRQACSIAASTAVSVSWSRVGGAGSHVLLPGAGGGRGQQLVAVGHRRRCSGVSGYLLGVAPRRQSHALTCRSWLVGGRRWESNVGSGDVGCRQVRAAARMVGLAARWVYRAEYMATYRSPAVLRSADGTVVSGTAALFTEPARKGGIAPWAGDFRL